MTNFYSFIQGSLEWQFSELFSANGSLWNQYKYIAFNIFTWRILIISYKILIITEISNGKTNSLTIYGILYRNVTKFYRQELQRFTKYLRLTLVSKFNFCFSTIFCYYWQNLILWGLDSFLIFPIFLSLKSFANSWSNSYIPCL